MSLRSFSWVANCNIWLNMAFMIMTIYGVSHYKPVPVLSQHHHVGKIITSGEYFWYSPRCQADIAGHNLTDVRCCNRLDSELYEGIVPTSQRGATRRLCVCSYL